MPTKPIPPSSVPLKPAVSAAIVEPPKPIDLAAEESNHGVATHIFDPETRFGIVKQNVVEAIQSYFPNGVLEGKKQSLRLTSISVDDPLDPLDVHDQQRTKEAEGTWAVPVKARVELVDNATGKVVDKTEMVLAKIPKLTSRFSYIVDGKERQVDHQSILKRGIFTRVADNGRLESRFNTKDHDGRQKMFSLYFDPAERQYSMKVGDTNVHAASLLRAMGVSESQMKEAWGQEIYAAGSKANDTKELQKLYRNFYRADAPDGDTLVNGIRAKMNALALDPDVTEMTVKKRFDHVDGESILEASRALLAVSRGDRQPSGYDDVRFKEIRHVEDFLAERVRESKRGLMAKIKNNLDRAERVDRALPRGLFGGPIHSFFTSSQLSGLGDQTNPLSMITGHTKHTIMGEHGISSGEQVVDEAKLIHPSSYGFLDPLHTPECFTGEMEVYTKRGWVRWDQIRDDDLFRSCLLTPHSKEIVFSSASRIIRDPYKGPIVVCMGEIVYRATPNHRMWISVGGQPLYSFCKAQEILQNQQETTYLGENGGLPVPRAHHTQEPYEGMVYCATVPSGFLFVRGSAQSDPFWSGNSDRTGINLQIPLAAHKVGNELKTIVYDLQAKKFVRASPRDLSVHNVAFPDSYKFDKEKKTFYPLKQEITVVDHEGETRVVKPADVRYLLPKHSHLFSATVNLIPFLPENNGNRVGYATSQAHQALSLHERQEPLVQSAADKVTGETFEGIVGKLMGHLSRTNGTVVKVDPEAVVIQTKDGKQVRHPLYNHYPTNNKKGLLHSEPLVRVGDVVKTGQPLADHNFTKNGKLSLGTNLRVGYMPFHGYNFEDGQVISESAAKQLSSVHMHKPELELGPNHHLSKSKFLAHAPVEYTRDQLKNVADDGVIAVGSRVKPGDPLILAMRRNEVKSEADGLSRVSRGLVRDWKPDHVVWEGDTEGEVVKVVRLDNKVKVHVKTLEPMQVGDKLVGRHGNKGICLDLRTHRVMTAEGWKRFDEVTKGTRIATLSPSGTLEYQTPTRLVRYPYQGDMVEVEARHVSLLCTPEHRLYVQTGRQQAPFSLVAAERCLERRVRMKRDVRYEATTPDRWTMPAVGKKETNTVSSVPSLAWWEFLGWYVTEGWSVRTRAGAHLVYLCQEEKANVAKVEQIRACLDALGFRYHYLEGRRFRITSKQLYTALRCVGDGASRKALPRYALGGSKVHLQALWRAMVSGDGHTNPNTGQEAFYSTSKQLIEQAQEILWKIGDTADVLVHMEEGTTIFQHPLRHTCYCVNRSSARGHVTVDPKKKGDRLHRVHGWSGEVACVEVPNHIIYVERNGKAVWIGNCTKIVPDHEMPTYKNPITGKEEHLQVLLNPLGVPGRINSGQILETHASWIAQKTGKPYKVLNFDPDISDYGAALESELKTHNLPIKIEVKNPADGRVLGPITLGTQYMMKLDQQVSKKMSARGAGYGEAYDGNMAPVDGGGRLGGLGNYGMLAHGAVHNLREFATMKGSLNDEVWRAVKTGEPIPTPKPSYAYDKFTGYLRGLGVHVEKKGNDLVLEPLTDDQILKVSNGAVKDPGRMLTAKDLRAETGGLFDPRIFGKDDGGLRGTKWGHLELATPMPNPIFEVALLTLLGLKQSTFENIIAQKENLGGKTGPEAIGHALDAINVNDRLTKAESEIKRATPEKADKLNKEIRYLRNLKKLGLTPRQAYMRTKIPILPPIMRPISEMPNGSLNTDDLNGLYRGVGLANKQLGALPPEIRALPEYAGKMTASLYDGMKALTGIGTLPSYHFAVKDKLQGIMPKIEGMGGPKTGYFQRVVLSRKQDLSARSTITPNQEIGLDEIAIPKAAAMKIFQPHLVRELRGLGMTTLDAQAALLKGDKHADVALDRVMKQIPVWAKRDPVLHKFGVGAHKAVLSKGSAIEIHPLVTTGLNADFDGDQQICNVFFAVPLAKWKADFYGTAAFLPVGEAMAARFRETVIGISADDKLFMCDLEDFPRIEGTGRRAHDNADFYEVPEGVRVFAWDENAHLLRLTPVKWWSVHQGRQVEIVTLRSGAQILTDDDERAVYGLDPDTMTCVRRRPREAEGLFVPVGHHVELEETTCTLDLPPSKRLHSKIDLDETSGYLFGLLVGDGWVVYNRDEIQGQVSFSITDPGVLEGLRHSLRSFFKEDPPLTRRETRDGLLPGSQGSCTYTVSCHDFAHALSCVGRGAENKHLPPYAFSAPLAFRRGVLAGWLDTDGTVNFVKAAAKERGQWQISGQSNSLRLVREMRLLAKSLGVSSTITATTTPKGKPSWRLTFSSVEAHSLGSLPLCGAKKERLDAFLRSDPPATRGAYARFDVVPISKQLANHMSVYLRKEKKLTESQYVILRNAEERNYLSRETARELLCLLGDSSFAHRHLQVFRTLTYNSQMRWDRVESVEQTGRVETGYDLSVPGYETFLSVEGLVLSNTMALFAPVSKEAIEEAKRALPSNNLFNHTYGAILHAPVHEAQTGIYLLSKPGTPTKHVFKTDAEAVNAYKLGQIGKTDVISVGGQTTTLGRVWLDNTLPLGMRGRIRSTMEPLNKKIVGSLLTEAAKNHATEFPEFVQAIKNYGNETSTSMPFSIGLDDLRVNKKLRDDFFAPIKAKELAIRGNKALSNKERDAQIVDLYRSSLKSFDAVLKDDLRARGSSLMTMFDSGGSSKWVQMKQLVGAPVMFEDAKGRPIPVPVLRSYSEGLPMAEYLTAAQGARMGTLSKAQGTSEPGALTKKIINTSMNQLVVDHDCKTSSGVTMGVDDPDIVDRFVAHDTKIGAQVVPAGTHLTVKLRDSARNAGITQLAVRSPLKCAHSEGVCQKCAGVSDNGKLWEKGTNLGIIAGQALGEPTTQMSMNQFHSGGILDPSIKTQMGSAFRNAESLLSMPKTMKHAASLSPTQGTVASIEKDPAGGYRVSVRGLDGKTHSVYAPTIRDGVAVGKAVKAGDPLSLGLVNPHALLPLAGIDAVKTSLANQLSENYGGIRKRHVETVVRSMTDLARVTDAGDHTGVIRGDLVSASKLNEMNKANPKAKPIRFEPVLKGVNQMPLAMQQDWAARLNFNRLRLTLQEGVAQGWSSNIHSTHPIPGLMFGAEFGKPPKGSNSPY